MGDTTTDTGAADTTATAPDDTGNQPQGGGQPDGQQGHHSQRQPRDDAKRFAKEGQPPVATQRFKRKVKRNGQEVEEEASEEDLWRARDEVARLQAHNRASTERFQRASEIQKEAQSAQQIAQALAKRDLGPLKDYFAQNKLSPKNALADLLEAAIQDEQITPEQRELMQLRAEKAAREEQDTRAKEDAEVQAFHREVEALRPEVETIWKHALEKTNLPKTPEMMKVTARIFLEAAEAGTKLAPEQVAEFARWELVEVNGGLVNEMEPAHFFQHFQPLVKRLDSDLSAEDFEKQMPGLAKRYHRLLFARLKGSGSTPSRGSQPAATTAPRQRGNTEYQLLEPFLRDIIR